MIILMNVINLNIYSYVAWIFFRKDVLISKILHFLQTNSFERNIFAFLFIKNVNCENRTQLNVFTFHIISSLWRIPQKNPNNFWKTVTVVLVHLITSSLFSTAVNFILLTIVLWWIMLKCDQRVDWRDLGLAQNEIDAVKS